MAFRIKSGESLGHCLRRTAKRQLDRAMAGLSGETKNDPSTVAHEARRSFKRVRSLLRLASEGFPGGLARKEGRRLRNAARALSELRDAEAAVLAFVELIEVAGFSIDSEDPAIVHARLLEAQQQTTNRIVYREAAFENVLGKVRRVRRGVRQWQLRSDEDETLEMGLRQMYQRARDAYFQALELPTDIRLHNLRKRIKDLFQILQLIAPIEKTALAPLTSSLSQIADYLGTDRDLTLLREKLVDPALALPNSTAVLVISLVDRQRSDLRGSALEECGTIFLERPKCFAKRHLRSWKHWRSQTDSR